MDTHERSIKSIERLVWWFARQYAGHTSASFGLEDLVQEARLAVWDAEQDYDERKRLGASFFSFTAMVIKRRLLGLPDVKAKGRAFNRKMIHLEDPLNANDTSPDMLRYLDVIEALDSNPEEVILAEEKRLQLRALMKVGLSDFQWRILEAWMDLEMDTRRTALFLGIPYKSVDNALQKIKAKLRLREELRDA